MKRFSIYYALLAVLFIGLSIPGLAYAGYDEGMIAFARGDSETALKELTPVAEAGNASAQYSLGLLYEKGQGVAQNYTEAAKWFRKSAEQGNAWAQYSMGLLYIKGQGVPKHYVLGYMWANLAGSQRIEDARKQLNILEKKMTPEQIAEAQKLSREFKPIKTTQHNSKEPTKDAQ